MPSCSPPSAVASVGRHLGVIALGLLAIAPREAAAEPLFAAPFLSFDTGSYPWSAAIGDLNGDGRPDLAVANSGAGTVSVLLGDGNGVFGSKTDFATGSSPRSVGIGDLNGDGRPDLAVANYGAGTVSVLLGNGAGSFGPKTDFATGGGPLCVAIGNLNADAWPDLAVADYATNAISVLLGDGAGSFGPKTDFATGSRPWSVAIGDLNADGKPDLAAANSFSNTVSVLLGNGNGTFAAKTDFATGSNPYSVAIGDLNADSHPDLAVANGISNSISVLLGNGTGGFGTKTDFATGGGPYCVAIRDLNADGRPDLATANSNSNSLSVLLGNGNGTFAAKTDFATGSSPYSVAIGDLNADGRPDLVLAAYRSDAVSVLVGNGAGSFGTRSEFATGSGPNSIAIADVNADERPDLAVANTGSATVSVLLGNGSGSFGAKTDFATGSSPYSVAVADLNGDGRPDLAVANAGSNTVSVLLGNGAGSFAARTDFATGSYPRCVAIADLNRDGRPDLAVANENSNTVSVLLGNGAGTFGTKTDFATGGGPLSVGIGDLNGDGLADLAVANYGSNTISVLLGTGIGTFAPKNDFATGTRPYGVAIGDLNGDGNLDLAVANYGAGTVSILLGDGTGSFGPKIDIATGNLPYCVTSGDLDGDGRADLAVANYGSYGSGTVAVLLGNGDGTFAAKIGFGTGSSPLAVGVGDLNADGRPDLAVPNAASNVVSVLLNAGQGRAAPALVSPADLARFDASPAFAWSAIDAASAYDLVVATDPFLHDPVWSRRIDAPAHAANYDGTPLAAGAGYYWSVRALCASSWTPLAPARRFFRTAGGSAPAAPELVSPVDFATVRLPEIFSWQPVAGVASYRLWIAASPTLADPLWISGLVSIPSLTVPAGIGSLVPGPKFWSVTAIDAFGNEGPAASPLRLALGANPSAPGPTQLVAPAESSIVDSRTVTFAWQSATGATNYDLVFSTSNSFPKASDATWTLAGLTQLVAPVLLPAADRTIYWKVTPRNAAGTGPASAVGSFQYVAAAGPIASVYLLNPAGEVAIGRNTNFAASARANGVYVGEIKGTWRVDGLDWSPFTATLVASKGASFVSPPLPTSDTGIHTVECRVTSPSSVGSGIGTYRVSDLAPGAPAALSVAVLPASLPADGTSEATITASVLDAAGLLVSSDNGRAIDVSVTGPGTVSPASGVTSSGRWTSTLRAGFSAGHANLTTSAAGLPAAASTVYMWESRLASLQEEALADLDDLEHLTVSLAAMPANIALWPRAYAVSTARDFVQAATEADTAAVARLMLAARAFLRLYHHDPETCTRYCGDAAVPGALTLMDDATRSFQSEAGLDIAATHLLENLAASDPPVAKSFAWLERSLLGHLDAAARWALDRTPCGVDPPARRILESRLATLSAATSDRFGTGYDWSGGGTSLLEPGLRVPAEASILGSLYVATQTQRELDRAVRLAGGSIATTYAEAQAEVDLEVGLARETSQGFHRAVTSLEENGDVPGLLAEMAGLAAASGPTLPARVASVISKIMAAESSRQGMRVALEGFSQFPTWARDAVSGVFGNTAGVAQRPATAAAAAIAAAAASRRRFEVPAARDVWSKALAVQSELSSSYEALQRQTLDAITRRDTVLTASLLSTLVDRADSLDLVTDYATSPASAAAGNAWLTIARFDSLLDVLHDRTEAARAARFQSVAAALGYLASPGDAIARQQAIDGGNAAVQFGATAQACVEQVVTGLFTTSAVPFVRMQAVQLPDSLPAGVTFRLEPVWTNLGAGNAVSISVHIVTDSSVVVLSPRLLHLHDLAPGDTARAGWTLLPLSMVRTDAAHQWLALVRLKSTSATGLGETRTLPLRVQRGTSTGTAGQDPSRKRLFVAIAPSPAGPGVRFAFGSAAAGRARLEIFDLAGRKVAVVFDAEVSDGARTVSWDGVASNGIRVASGAYIARLVQGRAVCSRKFVWLGR